MLARKRCTARAQYFVDAKVSEISRVQSRQGHLRVVVGAWVVNVVGPRLYHIYILYNVVVPYIFAGNIL